MPLAQYKQKRNFTKTPEPEGNVQKNTGPLTFVIQKHQATRLHYDFRLEFDGVLKSWAVPQGPSSNPEDKRLAVHVEDHPLEYANFEGIIPKGEYGGGTVMVWDRGVYMPYIDKELSGMNQELRRKESENILKKQLKEGHLTIIMLGEKVKGEFAVIKLKNADDQDAWLLIKKGDEYADAKKDLTELDRSVLTKRSMEQIAKDKDAVWHSNKEYDPKNNDLIQDETVSESEDVLENIKTAPKHTHPEVIKPMLAESTDKAFDNKNFIFEMKWDGYRALAKIEAGDVTLCSRNNIDYQDKFAPLFESLKKINQNMILDGEVVMVDKNGKPNFQWIQDYPASKTKGTLVYYVFDLLSFQGHDLTHLPLIERKKILKEILPNLPHLAYSDHIEKEGKSFFAQAKKLKLEGIMAKRSDSSYRIGTRSKDWLKIKTGNTVDAIICGFTKPRGRRKYFGALVVGLKINGSLKYIGHTGGGFSDKQLKVIHEQLLSLAVDHSPFKEVPKTNEPVTWVKPTLKCEVTFSNWTTEKIMRHPLFVKMIEKDEGERVTDKDDEKFEEQENYEDHEKNEDSKNNEDYEVRTKKTSLRGGGTTTKQSHSTKNIANKINKRTNAELQDMRLLRHQEDSEVYKTSFPRNDVVMKADIDTDRIFRTIRPEKEEPEFLKIGKRELKITNPTKLFWPKEKYTKTDLITYYHEIAPIILPYLQNRPQSLLRFPHGIEEESFFQKDVSNLNLDWVMRVQIKSDSQNKKIEYLLCQDEATLIYMVNLGCIDFNPWNSTVKNIENPDYAIIDLDPEGLEFSDVVKVAQKVHQFLEKLEIESYPKTSGSRGMHIFIPMGQKYNHDQVRIFTELLCSHIQVEMPELISIRRNPKDRQGKVYLDYLQNGKGKTLASVYSVRPKPGAYVSTPLEWSEVTPKLHPSQFTIQTTIKRLEKKGDLFKGVLGKGINMKKVLKTLSERI